METSDLKGVHVEVNRCKNPLGCCIQIVLGTEDEEIMADEVILSLRALIEVFQKAGLPKVRGLSKEAPPAGTKLN